MTDATEHLPALPDAATLAQAVRMFLEIAYPQGTPDAAARFIPPDDVAAESWLMGGLVERTPAGVGIGEVRSFALRLGNARYPHMKLRLSRVPSHEVYVLTVDSHDAILEAPVGSGDHEALEALKRHNAAIASQITTALNAAKLPTEANFLREEIRRVKQDNPDPPE